jgi:hypothetical protein
MYLLNFESISKMLTRTSRDVLTSLSDVVEQLIQLVVATEERQSAMPRLDTLSNGVVDQVQSLTQVSQRIMDLPDSDVTMKEEMSLGSSMGSRIF